MLELKSAIISTKNKNKNPIDLVFDNGINFIDYEKREIFSFLADKEKYLSEGSFIINDQTFIPYNEKSNKSLFFLKITSQNISLDCCFVIDSTKKKESILNIQNAFLALKAMPLNTKEEQLNKVKKIIETISNQPIGFVLIDLNNNVNKDNKDDINSIIQTFESLICFVVLKEKVQEVVIQEVSEEETEEDFNIDDVVFEDFITIGGDSKKETITRTATKPVVKKQKDKKAKESNDGYVDTDGYLLFAYKLNKPINPFYYILNFIKRNILILVFLLVSYVGFVLTLLLSPQYLKIGNNTLGITFLFLGITFLLLYLFNIYSCYDFYLDKKANQLFKKWKYASITLVVITLIGAGISYLSYYLFVLNTKDFSFEVYNIGTIIGVIAGTVIILALPFFVKYIYKLVELIKRKIK